MNLDHDIIMHRDAHFSGSFEEMHSYYEQEGLGVQPEFDLEQIAAIAKREKEGEELSSLLTEEEMKRVEGAKKAYLDLRAIYEIEKETTPLPRLIADLILSESFYPEEEIARLVSQAEKSVPSLLHILQWEEGYDPLYPGYGYAPYFALQALSKIGDKRAIVPIFEMLNKETRFGEEAILSALLAHGNEAKYFLLNLLLSRPITQDNIQAAYALSAFPIESEIEKKAWAELNNTEVWKHPLLFTYLLSLIQENKQSLQELNNNPSLPQNLKKEIAQSLRT